MTEAQLNAWFALFTAANAIGDKVLKGIRALAKRTLTTEELQQVLAKWNDNVARSGTNAGLPPDA